jgi:thiamine-monophosphate kinase
MAGGVEDFAKENNLNPHELVMYGGEEYQIVATIPKAKLRQAKLAAKRVDLPLHIMGSAQKGKSRVLVNGKIVENRGYAHFSKR